MPIRITTYSQSANIPKLPGTNVFHSSAFFKILEQTPGYTPILLVASDNKAIIGKLLCINRRNSRIIGFTDKTYVYGIGEYFESRYQKEYIFKELLNYFTQSFAKSSFLVEFRNLEEPLFGYRYFRQNDYFPVKWLRVRNSLHHDTIDKWMSSSRKKQIARGIKNGAKLKIAQSPEEVICFFNMLKKYYSPQIHRYLPDLRFFLSFYEQDKEKQPIGSISLVLYKEKIIGGAVCIYSGNTAYLIFSGGMRKSYAHLYPGVLAVWKAMTHAHAQKYRHFEFIDAGLPFKKFSYRDFILRFGGKQLSSRRWFKIKWKWLNKLFIKLYV